MKILIVLPTLNEAGNLAKVVSGVRAASSDTSILIVDDQSTDSTPQLANALAEQTKEVSVLHRIGPRGLGAALVAGLEHAKTHGFEGVIILDADLSHDPSQLPLFIQALATFDLVIGSRFKGPASALQWSKKRQLLSYCARKVAQILFGMEFTDPTSGYKGLSRKGIQTVLDAGLISNGYFIHPEIAHVCRRNNLRIVELPISFFPRATGTSKVSALVLIEAIWEALFLRLNWNSKRRAKRVSVTPKTT